MGVSSRPVECQCLFLKTNFISTHLTGKQSVGVEDAVLKKVGDHMPDKQIVDNNKKMVRIRTILSSQMAEHKCESYKIMK